MDTLDAFLPDDEPHATLHDAVVMGLHIDYAGKRLVMQVRLCVGDPDSTDETVRERRRRAELIVEGLQFCVIDPPGPAASIGADGLWLTADGILADAPTDAGTVLARQLGPGDAGWFLFFSDLNAYMYFAGRRRQVRWV